MTGTVVTRYLLVLLPFIAAAALAASNDRERWILGTWTAETSRHASRTVIFHADHTWGVRGYVPFREEIHGRRWRVAGDQLILTYPGDDGLETMAYKIVSFTHDKFATDAFTYTREK
jgi:hypothetical protein